MAAALAVARSRTTSLRRRKWTPPDGNAESVVWVHTARKFISVHQFGPAVLFYRVGGSPWIVPAMADAKTSLVERLFAEHRGALQAFFRRRLRTKADAPDLAQEVYVRMLRISDQDAIRNPVLYLYTVANNLVKEHAVLDRRQAAHVDIDQAPAHEQLETLPAFDGDLDTFRRIVRLRAVLTQLRPKWHAAVQLRFAHGLTYPEIALRLGVSPRMAKKYVAQALAHCRRRMARLG